MSETKTAQYFSPPITIRNIYNGSDINNSVQSVCPNTATLNIAQGDGQGERIGNRINLVSLICDINIYPVPYSVVNNSIPQPAYVKIWFIHQKSNPTGIPLANSTRMVQFGSASQALTGLLRDMSVPLNQEFVTTHYSKVFKIGNSSYWGSGTSSPSPEQNWTNNEFHLGGRLRIDLAKYLPKVIVYDDTNNVPSTRGLFMMFEFVDVDNTYPQNISGHHLEYTLSMKYKDP